MPYALHHLGRVLTGRYLGEGPRALLENIGRAHETKSGMVIVRKTNGNEVRGRLLNFDSPHFNFWYAENGHQNAGDAGFSLRSNEVYRSYLA